MSSRLGLPWIAVSDPLLHIDENLSLAWYTGRQGDSTQLAIARVVEHLTGHLEPLCVGGSGGGFAALVTTSLIDGRAAALVWNPQTDVRAYAPFAVDAYLRALGLTKGETPDYQEIEPPPGIHWTIPPLGQEKSVLYLQNSGDWHVAAHAARFLESNKLNPVRFNISSRADMAVTLANWGEGHAAPPNWILDTALASLCLRGESAIEAVSRLTEVGAYDSATPSNTPTPVSPSPLGEPRIRAELKSDGEDSVLVIKKSDGLHLPNYTTYSVSGRTHDGERLATGAQRKPIVRFAGSRLRSAFVVARDGFGSMLGTAEAVAEPHDQRRAGGPSKSGIFAYGSCVSRDAFNFPGAPELTDYIARSPMGSAFADAPPVEPNYDANPSAFQRRMVHTDWNKNLAELLAETSHQMVLVDLIDERISLATIGDTVVAFSPEVQRMGFEPKPDETILFGSKEHFERFQSGWRELLRVCDPSRVVVSKAFWAERTEAGDLTGDPERTRLANQHLRQYYEAMEDSGVRWISYGTDVTVAAQNHRWGGSPFHYVDAFYEATISGLEEVLEEEYRMENRPTQDG